jgi:creatinine amidohydrolase
METPRILRWESLTKTAFDRLDPSRCVVLVTCSPMEVHGPHLPLGADALEGEGLAERMVRLLPERHRQRTFLALPMVWSACDVVPQPGSLQFRPSTTVAFLRDLGRTLGAQGFRDVWVSNFHGGPRHFLSIEKGCELANRRHGTRMASIFSLLIRRLTNGTSNLDDVLAEVPGVRREDLAGDTHGGLIETSQLLALHGDWVDPDYKQLPRLTVDGWLQANGRPKTRAGRGDPRRFFAMLSAFRAGIHFFSQETYSGAPARASAEIGERILDLLGGKAAEAASELLDGTLSPSECHSPLWPWRFLFLNPLLIRISDRLLGVPRSIG